MKRIFPLVLLTAAWAPAQPLKLNLDHLASKAKESVDVSLDANMLKLAGNFLSRHKGHEADAKKLIADLKGVFVRSFTFAKPGEYSDGDVEPVRKQLTAGAGWSRIVNVKEKDGATEVYTKAEGGNIAGLAVIAAEPKELTIVYIDGPIDIGRLADLGGQFGIPKVKIPGAEKKGTK
jgi:hypothetical protein